MCNLGVLLFGGGFCYGSFRLWCCFGCVGSCFWICRDGKCPLGLCFSSACRLVFRPRVQQKVAVLVFWCVVGDFVMAVSVCGVVLVTKGDGLELATLRNALLSCHTLTPLAHP